MTSFYNLLELEATIESGRVFTRIMVDQFKGLLDTTLIEEEKQMAALSEEMIAKLKKLAASRCADETDEGEFNEDFIAYDWFGGNMDDAYAGGIRTGEIQMAREVLSAAGIGW